MEGYLRVHVFTSKKKKSSFHIYLEYFVPGLFWTVKNMTEKRVYCSIGDWKDLKQCLGLILVWSGSGWILLKKLRFFLTKGFYIIVCLFVSNKRKNGWTDQAQIEATHVTPGKNLRWGHMSCSELQKVVSKILDFCKILKIHDEYYY